MSDFVSPSTRRRRAGIAASTSTPPVFLDSISRNDDGAEKRQRILSSTTSTALNSPATPRTASRIGNERFVGFYIFNILQTDQQRCLEV